jgi:hypothetical protein
VNEIPDDAPACWSWPLPDLLTREQEAERLEEASLRQCHAAGTMDHYLPMSACMMLTRDWPRYRFSVFHNERCAICGQRFDRAVNDHDHRTGLVRGLLCVGCNISEGTNWTSTAVQLYRERPPAAILGVQIYYVGRGWPQGWWSDEAVARTLTGNPDWVRVGQ